MGGGQRLISGFVLQELARFLFVYLFFETRSFVGLELARLAELPSQRNPGNPPAPHLPSSGVTSIA